MCVWFLEMEYFLDIEIPLQWLHVINVHACVVPRNNNLLRDWNTIRMAHKWWRWTKYDFICESFQQDFLAQKERHFQGIAMWIHVCILIEKFGITFYVEDPTIYKLLWYFGFCKILVLTIFEEPILTNLLIRSYFDN